MASTVKSHEKKRAILLVSSRSRCTQAKAKHWRKEPPGDTARYLDTVTNKTIFLSANTSKRKSRTRLLEPWKEGSGERDPWQRPGPSPCSVLAQAATRPLSHLAARQTSPHTSTPPFPRPLPTLFLHDTNTTTTHSRTHTHAHAHAYAHIHSLSLSSRIPTDTHRSPAPSSPAPYRYRRSAPKSYVTLQILGYRLFAGRNLANLSARVQSILSVQPSVFHYCLLRAVAAMWSQGDPTPSPPSTLNTFYLPQSHAPSAQPQQPVSPTSRSSYHDPVRIEQYTRIGSTAKGVVIGICSVLGAAAFCLILFAIVYYCRYTQQGRIFLDRLTRPGEYDDEQQFAKEEAEALEDMDDLQRTEYLRAKAFIEANPPESVQTDISLSQFLAIQEKGVSAWEFEPELEIANCFVEARTEIEFFDSVCSVQSNLPMPKQNEVYYWEAKLYDKPETTEVAIGVTTKPYPLFRLPGYHKYSIAYMSDGSRRHNQPFSPTPYGPAYVQGDVIGVGYRPRTGTIFFTRNGKKLDEVAHGLKTQNFFPTVGANGPCQVHVNFGQMGFVFIEANVKKWGLAPMTGSLAPPPPYGSEQGSILLEGGREGVREGMAGTYFSHYGHARTSSQQMRLGRNQPTSPGPQRSPTDISLAQLSLVDSYDDDHGEGTSAEAVPTAAAALHQADVIHGLGFLQPGDLPPEYSSPQSSPQLSRQTSADGGDYGWGDQAPLIHRRQGHTPEPDPPIPSYDAVVAGDTPRIRVRSATETSPSAPSRTSRS
ncbi:SPRY-domain-containing protein [Westerdykella ornata]|uniref:Protein SSH4 n=1 Tax=Westerdykella ornata TaxID=318751 RepID=A0A6A6J6L1_WESOR|nr:SPRY-domain-containing protein [Westerdykella ornata]KAF2271847.1 SPRY-domain-containing protein [Westerdykella ornata]